MNKPAKRIPFDFVLEELYSLEPIVRPMFGCYAVYVQNKIVLILRLREDHPDDNGVWIATEKINHSSLQNEFPSIRTIRLFGESVSSWQNLPYEADDFESNVLRVCELIRKKDVRIGKVPKARKKKK